MLNRGCGELGISLNDQQAQQFISYLEILQKKNQEMNLTAIEEDEEIITKHFLDSLTATRAMDLQKGTKVIDIGTGAGFPGVPLKIYRPQIQLTLLDSLNKRINFLRELCQQLGLAEEIEYIHGRAEDYGKNPKYREGFDYVVSRAVAELGILAEYCLPLVKKGGYFLALKGPLAEEELEKGKKALKILGGKVEEIFALNLPLREDKRNLVLIKKIDHTPKDYPRKAGTPQKKPLG